MLGWAGDCAEKDSVMEGANGVKKGNTSIMEDAYLGVKSGKYSEMEGAYLGL